ncbi:MAG: LysM peptidoglycan-binding domain-containing protein [Chitinispirillaceae bacterium]|nr:LysM peptidoglycan-binding domain-containing protein [Chitinispirillaceae bacterium]
MRFSCLRAGKSSFFLIALLPLALTLLLSDCASGRARLSTLDRHAADSSLAGQDAIDSTGTEGAFSDSAATLEEQRYEDPADLIQEAKLFCEENNFRLADSCLKEAVKAIGAMDNTEESGEWAPSNRFIDEIAALYKEKMPDSFPVPEEITMAVFQSLMLRSIDSISIMPPESLAQAIMLCQKNIVYDVPMIWNQRVQRALYFYLRNREKTVDRWFTRAPYYLPVMKQMFAESGLPQDLAYLPLIESGFNPLAYSYEHASGIWQFIASTGKIFGLKRTFWVDERRDPLRSTAAAIAYLRKLYGDFNDWHLALAAYNCGEYGLARALKRNQTNDFWNLKRLPNQTKHYVPFYLAALTIAKNPKCFGVTPMPTGTLPLDTVHLAECIAFDDIAAGLGMDPDTLKKLNPHCMRWCTPPDTFATVLYLPEGKKTRWQPFVATLPPEKKVKWSRYRIKQGDNLEMIAQRHSLTPEVLKTINKLSVDKLTTGHHLFIPLSDTIFGPDVAYTLPPASDIKTLDLPDYEFAGVVTRHRIRRGDNLGKIARKYRVSIRQLCRWNRITARTILRPGRVLVVSRPRPVEVTPAATAVAVAAPSAKIHLVQIGDTPFSVSRKYGLTVQELSALNKLDVSHPLIRIGQKLVVSKAGDTAAAAIAAAADSMSSDSARAAAASATLAAAGSKKPATTRDTTAAALPDTATVDFSPIIDPGPRYHVIAKGENLYRISRLYAIPIAAIMKANGIPDASIVRIGDSLLIPPRPENGVPSPDNAQPGTVFYTVKDGDTLLRIAAQFGVPVDRLYESNNLSSDAILQPGTVLKVITTEDR